MSERASYGVIVALLLLFGCAPLPATPPDKAWTELRSTHFVVQSDLRTEEVEALGEQFERSYAALRSYVFPGTSDLPGESRVVVLATANEFQQIQTEPWVAFFRRRSGLLGASQEIVLSYAELERALQTFRHELTHRFVAHYFPVAPTWLNEGLAQYLASATIDEDTVEIGTPVKSYSFDGWQWQVRGTPFADIWSPLSELRERAPFDGRDYPAAWGLVQTLLLGEPRHRDAFGAYMAELHEGRLSEPAAFAKHFQGPLLASLEEAYRQFPRRPPFAPERVKLGPVRTESSVRLLTRTETYALWGELRPDDELQRALAFRDADEAIRSDPSSSRGYVLRGTLHFASKRPEVAERDLRQAVKLEPWRGEPIRALTALLLARGGLTPEVAELAVRLRSLARHADDYVVLARWALASKNAEDALRFANQGMELDRACVNCYVAAAMAAARLTDFEAAVRLQTIAINIAAENAQPSMSQLLTRFHSAREKAARRTPP